MPRANAPDVVLNAHIVGASAILGLTIDPAWHAAILDHLRAIDRAAQLVLDVPLDDHVEAAPIFKP